jgi:transposase
MSQERLSMRKIKEVLRLRYEKHLSHRAIARSCGIGCTTAREFVVRAQAAGLSWPLPADLDDAALERLLFPPAPGEGQRALPDWPVIHQELRRKGVTLSLLWQEYKGAHPEGYNYSRFCELYRAWSGTLDVTMSQEYKAGEYLFVDYAGQTMTVTDPQTGETVAAYVFVAAQGASNYTYAEASFSMDVRHWIGAHVRAFEFFGGINAVVTPDNAKVAVTLPCRYEPDLNPTYHDLAVFYGFTVLPTRIVHPRDKAKVEAAVQGVERWVMAPLRHQKFFSLTDLNRALVGVNK